ncbi:MAG: tRNA epoxyqueuosine(34) reductase QueG [Planctomycetes bacterium]|nr:tRNA epoxyqueuosine(34) reductase QueG [Planctomycetota bacterium]
MQPAPSPVADPDAVAADLRREALRLGFSRVGITTVVEPPHHESFRGWLAQGLAGATEEWLERHEPLRRTAAALLDGVASVVMLATDHATLPDPAHAAPGQGRVARYAWGDDYHDLLRARVNALAAWLEGRVPGCRTRGVVDSAPLAERDFAWAAGLGWFGKNTMLISPTAGSYFFLTGFLTDLPLPADEPLRTDHCGTCTACLDACPTSAFPEPGVLDASRCISSLTVESREPVPLELRAGMGDWLFGCDVCQEVCPWNRHAPGSGEPALQPRIGQATLPLGEILALDESGFRRRFRGSAIRRAKRSGLLRSAAIALGNRPDPASLPALAAAAHDGDPVIREAARWALARWIDAGVMADECRRAIAGQASPHDVTSSTSAAGSRPGPSVA